MRTLRINGIAGDCEIFVGEKLENLSNYTQAEKIFVISDENVLKYHSSKLPDKAHIIKIRSGEGNKTLSTVQTIYEQLLELEADRSSLIVGMGGGIVCDIAGFAAATYLRGTKLGLVPTTLLAQVDASIGGKNGVNFKGYKNMVGTIRQPSFCICDSDLLKTLPKSELVYGMAEVVKHACISDLSLFEYLEKNFADALLLNSQVIQKLIYDSINVKVKIVNSDETEKGERMKLNFGHTIGHAIEKVYGLPHGQAVSIGLVAASRLSASKGLIKMEHSERIESLLKRIELPTSLKIDSKSIANAIRKDKKRSGEDINMILLESIGSACINKIKLSEIEGVLDDMC